MPYKNVTELPDSVRHVLPDHAQDIYKEAFNSAFDQYENPAARHDGVDREEVSHKVAWTAVKKVYEKGDDGLWHKK